MMQAAQGLPHAERGHRDGEGGSALGTEGPTEGMRPFSKNAHEADDVVGDCRHRQAFHSRLQLQLKALAAIHGREDVLAALLLLDLHPVRSRLPMRETRCDSASCRRTAEAQVARAGVSRRLMNAPTVCRPFNRSSPISAMRRSTRSK